MTNGNNRFSAKALRIRTLVKKEFRQMVRDPSSIAMGVVLPVILILLFGYGLSLDVKNVKVAVVLDDASPDVTELISGFRLSPYFDAMILIALGEKIANINFSDFLFLARCALHDARKGIEVLGVVYFFLVKTHTYLY